MAEKQTIDQAMARLAEIVATLEGGKCTLDESLKLFEEGTGLAAGCTKQLREARQRIVRLSAVEAGDDDSALADRQGEDMGRELSE